MQDITSILRIVREVLAADFGCDEKSLDQEGVSFFTPPFLYGCRRFPHPEKFLAVMTMGAGIVVCCSKDRLPWAKAHLNGLTRKTCFLPLKSP
jgi:hypothetical protein